jgi:hypothetical protein
MQEVAKAATLVAESFVKLEPLSQHLNLSQDSFRTWVTDVITSSTEQGLTFVAIDDKSQDMLGCLVTERMTNESVPEYPAAKPIFEMLDSLYVNGTLEMQERDKSLHMFLAATTIGHEQKGVCRGLTKYSLLYTQSLGFTDLYAELTAPGTQHVFLNRLGFKALNEITYNSYSDVFKGCKGKVVLAHRKI